jgi:hypothetical protein
MTRRVVERVLVMVTVLCLGVDRVLLPATC